MSTAIKDRQAKYGRKVIRDDKVKFNFDITIMNLFCAYVLSENANIHRVSLATLKNIFNAIDESMFDSNPACIIRYHFIKDALIGRVDKGITNRNILIRDIMGLVGNKYSEISPEAFDEISNEDVSWAESTISSCANLQFVNNHILELGHTISEYVNTDYNHKLECVEKLKDSVTNMSSEFRKNSVDTDELNNTVDFMNLENTIADVYRDAERPAAKLKTGMRAFNNIIAGGFSGGAVYSLFGLPGDGKTITLQNLAYQLKKYNTEYVCKDKTKIPCIVFLTMENKIASILNSFYNIACNPTTMTELPMRQTLAELKKALGVTADSPINIIVRYKPINSVNTDYLYKLTDDLADKGFEVICMIQDYIKRIRPKDYVGDMRLDLGSVINDFANYAKFYNVPVITASQFNREGVRVVDESRNSNRHDLVSKLGRAMIGESGLIEENLDASIFITKEVQNGNTYMGFKLAKKRYRIFTNETTFYQPFQDGSIAYVEDEDAAFPAYKTKLMRDEDSFRQAFGDTIKLEAAGGKLTDLIEEMGTPDITPGRRESLEESILGGNVVAGFNQLKQVVYRDYGDKIQAVYRVDPNRYMKQAAYRG